MYKFSAHAKLENVIKKEVIGKGNTVLTPPIASATVESRTKMAELSAKNLVAVLKGELPISLVNK